MTTQADTNAAVRKREECLEDERAFNDALCGRDSGSDRYSAIRQRNNADDQQRKQAEEQRFTALEMLLLDDEYRAAWQSAMNAINRARDAVNDALVKAETELKAAQKAHNQLLENAATFGYVRVLLDTGEYFYTMNGERLSDDEMFSENPSMKAAIEASADRLASAQERYAFVSGKDQELITVEQKVNDPDKPMASIQGLAKIEEEIKAINHSVSEFAQRNSKIQLSQSPVLVPELTF